MSQTAHKILLLAVLLLPTGIVACASSEDSKQVNYSMTAKGTNGFAFANWTGSFPTNNATVSFTMASNLVLTANFRDTNRPTLTVEQDSVSVAQMVDYLRRRLLVEDQPITLTTILNDSPSAPHSRLSSSPPH